MENKAGAKPTYIICVDDEPELAEAYAKVAASLGFEPLLATSGEEALAHLEKFSRRTVLVVSDYQMPGMNGLELRKKMLSGHGQVPFVLTSGHISKEEALKSIELKISGFLAKPFHTEAIRNLITESAKERIASLREEDDLVNGFISDAENLIEEMESLLLGLEAQPADIDTINRIFAIAHTIKGASGFFQPKTIHRFTHAYEDFLTPYKRNATPVPPSAMAVLLKGLDVIKSLLTPLRDGTPESTSLEELLEIFKAAPAESEAAAASNDPAKPAEGKAGVSSRPREEVKVPFAILDSFMELSGEITVIRNMINKLVRALEKDSPGNRNVALLSELLDEMHKINGQMQDKIVDLRKVGCKQIYRPLKRAVRDLATALGKEVDLQTKGEDIRVDTSIAEILSNSLIHMVRNCVDHGLEATAARTAAGKPAMGSIVIETRESNQEVLVTIQDDGKGIDTEVIRKKAVEKNLFTAERAQAMSEKELQAVIFDSGFSTAAKVTDVSGRGVGMDMVKKAVTGGGGRIEIDSQVGKGTSFRLCIPIPRMVTIISSLLVRAGNHLLAIPQENLSRLVAVPEAVRAKSIRSPHGADLLIAGEDLVPIINLDAVLNGARENYFRITEKSGDCQFAIVNCERGQFAILVTQIHDAEDTVVKKLGRDLKELSLFRGATFLGDGAVGLILDISELVRFTGIAASGQNAKIRQEIEELSTARSLLLLEIDQPGIFGIYLEDIFRLETFPAAQIQLSGNVPVIIYRGDTCPIFGLDELLAYPMDSNLGASVDALVLATPHGYVAVRVKRIVDLVKTESKLDTELSDRQGVLGALLHDERAVTVLSGTNLGELAIHRVRPALSPAAV